METINVGVIGTGFMGKMHTYGYKTIPFYYDNLPFNINLEGVCSKHIERADSFKKAHQFSYATDNMDELINDEKIDVINICTPNYLHKDTIIKALKKGKHIYCDKPLTSNYEEALEVLEVYKKSNSICQMTFQNRFFPSTQRAKQLIENGKLGNIISFESIYLHSGSVDKNRPIGWKQDKNLSGGGVLVDLGPHILDILCLFLGKVEGIWCKNQILYKTRPDILGKSVEVLGEDASYLTLQMENGAIGNVTISKIATGTNDELSFEIYGDKGAIKFNLMNPNWLEFFDNTLPEEEFGGDRGFKKIECVQRFKKPGGTFPSSKSSIGWMRGHVHCLYNFLECVYNKKSASPSFEEGAYIQYLIEMAYKAHEKQGFIKI